MKKWHIVAAVSGGKYVGDVEAETEKEAIEKAWNELSDNLSISLCHQCSSECEDPEPHTLYASEVKP